MRKVLCICVVLVLLFGVRVQSQPAPQRMSPAGVEFIARLESFKPAPYVDSAGVVTIGYGMRSWQGRTVSWTYPGRVSRTRARQELMRQLALYESLVRSALRQDVDTAMFDALVSVTYNLGRVSPTLTTRIRQKQPVRVDDFIRTATVAGRPVRGLYVRRVQEFLMFTGVYPPPRPLSYPEARTVARKLGPYAFNTTP